MVKNMPVMQETWVQSLGWEDPLEKGMATHSSTLAWRIPQTEEPGGPQSLGLQRVRHSYKTNSFTFFNNIFNAYFFFFFFFWSVLSFLHGLSSVRDIDVTASFFYCYSILFFIFIIKSRVYRKILFCICFCILSYFRCMFVLFLESDNKLLKDRYYVLYLLYHQNVWHICVTG